ncbi:hypothetical protein QTP88_013709 [Uroleucon formosanum]
MDDIRVCDKRSSDDEVLKPIVERKRLRWLIPHPSSRTGSPVDKLIRALDGDLQARCVLMDVLQNEYWRLQGVPWTQDACDCKLVFRLAGVRLASNSRIPRAPDAAGEGQMNNRSSKYHGEKQIRPDHY